MTEATATVDRPAHSWIPAGLAVFGVGWGANQFASLLPVYRDHTHLSQTTVTAMFGTYAIGLIPALLVVGPVSDRLGRRRVLRPVLIASVAATVLLIAGAAQVWLLFAGRFLAGVASGAAFGPGSAWIKELSAGGSPGAGARRAAISLSAGFGAGPFTAGLVAQWAPLPEVLPYLVHVALMLGITPLAWNAPETVRAARAGRADRPHRVSGAGRAVLAGPARAVARAAGTPRFGRVVAPAAPWVFGLPTIGFTVLTGLVSGHTAGLPVAFAAVVIGLTLLAGVLVQPLAAWVEGSRPGLGMPAGLLAATVGLGLAVAVAVTTQPLLVPVAAMALGASYGILLVSGLREVERLADPDELAGLVAVFYALTYLGFAVPYLLAELAPHLGYPFLLAAAAILTLATAALTAVLGRAEPEPSAPDRTGRTSPALAPAPPGEHG
ncbi:MAG TPA: MFS transporter [Mycobacteriales bacterium]|nr:MFS transporter [Mycobacteriales bacterium]